MIFGRRAAALLEVLAIYLVGGLVVRLFVRLSGLDVANPLATFTVGITNAELLTATRQMLALLLLQYGGYFALIIPVGWWHRRRGPAEYGLTRAGHPWRILLIAGVATAALTEWPVVAVNLADTLWHLGDTVPWRQALFDTSWTRWQFWLFSAVLSWALVAVLEELFYRGYCQRRLAEEWGDGAAIVGTASLFVFSHSQYLSPDAYNIGMVVSLFTLAVGFGVVYAWTRSLVPSIIAHAIINVPMTPPWQGVLLAAFLIGVAFTARRGAAVVAQIFSGTRPGTAVALGVLGAGYAVAARRVDALEFAAIGMLLVAIVLEATERWRERLTRRPAPAI